MTADSPFELLGLSEEAIRSRIGDRLFLTVSEVAPIVHVDERTLRRAISAGTFPGIRIGPACIRVPTAALVRLALGTNDNEAA